MFTTKTAVNVIIQRPEERVRELGPHTLTVVPAHLGGVLVRIENGFGYAYAVLTPKEALAVATAILNTVEVE